MRDSIAAIASNADMLEPFLAYINDRTWAQWAFVLFLFVPPMLMSWGEGARGLASLDIIIGWCAFLLMLLLLIA